MPDAAFSIHRASGKNRVRLSDDSLNKHKKHFNDLWNACLSKFYEPIVSKVVELVKQADVNAGQLSGVAVQLGPVPSDHTGLLQRLDEELEGVGAVAQMNMAYVECMSSCVSSLIDSILRALSSNSHIANDVVNSYSHKNWTMLDLCHWLDYNLENNIKIIISISSLEVVKTSLFDKMMETLYVNRSKLDIVFLFTMASGMQSVSTVLSSHVLSLLRVQYVSLPKPSIILERLICETLFDHKFPFKIHPQLLKRLVERFDNETQSLHDIRKALDLAILQYFTEMKHRGVEGILVMYVDEPRLQGEIEKLSGPGKQVVQFVRTLREEKAVDLNDKDLLADLFDYVTDELTSIVLCLPLLEFIRHICQQVDHDISLLELYFELTCDKCVTQTCDMPVFDLRKCLTMWTSLPRHEIVHNLEVALKVLTNAIQQRKAIYMIAHVIKEINNVMDSLRNVENLQAERDKVIVKTPTTPEVEKTNSGTTNRWQYQKNLRSKIQTEKKTDVYEELKMKTFNTLMDFIKSNLYNPKDFDYYQLLYFTPNSVVEFLSTLSPSIKPIICNALSKPASILGKQCDDWQIDGLDTSLCWQVAQNHGKTINVKEWLEEVCEIWDETFDSLQARARFFRACGELELVGFIKSNPVNASTLTRITNINFG